MRFSPNEDQQAFLSGLDHLIQSKAAEWRIAGDWVRFDWAPGLDALLEENGFYDCAAEPTLGLVAAAEMTCRLAALPVLVESAASSMLRPLFASGLPRPVAVAGPLAGAIPFLPVARSVIAVSGAEVRGGVLGAGQVEAVESLFAYPMGRLKGGGADLPRLEADPAEVRTVLAVALAAELAGALKGGLDAVVAHVRDRHQFGRPLGSFQAIQHRLATAAVRIEAGRWLVLRAAHSRSAADAAMALGHLQEGATGVVRDLHQFMGAMGLTLEHPLHRWTYRARLLKSALGGAGDGFRRVAAERWAAA